MKKFRCHFPGCSFETNNRNHIDYHHIVPVHMGGSNKIYNLISLCPTHHRHIYVEGDTQGIHSIKNKESISIIQMLDSSDGKAMLFKQLKDDKEKVIYFRSNAVHDW